MKKPILFTLALSLLFSCGNPETTESKESQEQQKVEQTSEKETKEKSRPTFEDDDRVSGFYDLTVNDKTYKSNQLWDDYCDMTYMYKAEKSMLSIRFKDADQNDALMIVFYGDEDFIKDPTGTIADFMFSDADNKVNIQFMPGDKESKIISLTMVEGSLEVTECSKGKFKATFKGKAAEPGDVVTKKNLFPMEGSVELTTTNVTEMGKDKEG